MRLSVAPYFLLAVLIGSSLYSWDFTSNPKVVEAVKRLNYSYNIFFYYYR